MPEISFLKTRHDIRLHFSETAESLRTRLRALSGTQLIVGRGLIPMLRLMVQDDELCVTKFGRTLFRGRVESLADGS